MLIYSDEHKTLVEENYEIKNTAKHAALLTTGNGYFGVRGSFEEFGAVNVQGTYVRGLIDQAVEIPSIYVDNIYMKKYYINELEAKKFEYQDVAINVADFLLMRFKIGNHIFYPWEGIIKKWIRYIDVNDGSLNREVVWDDGEGHLSKITYKRFASFANNHHYFLTATLEKLNHDLEVEVQSGIDTYIKSNGQKKSKLKQMVESDTFRQYLFDVGDFYDYEACIAIHHRYEGVDLNTLTYAYEDGMYLEKVKNNQSKVTIEKSIYLNATMDYASPINLIDENKNGMLEMLKSTFKQHYQRHTNIYQSRYDMMRVRLSDNQDEALLNFANYHTLIGIDRYTDKHSVTAKNLTGEKYNQFVWWDAEIYQFPIYLLTMPDAAKNLLMYRYHRLEQSKKNAQKDGYDGAKYAFCSSVYGDEKVWAYARHPFLQIHINADIAYAILQYFIATKDEQFMIAYGIEMLYEIAKYFISRVSYNENENIYELNGVTGTDEHHPYVNNNRYTNFLVQYILKETYDLVRTYHHELNHFVVDENQSEKMKDISDNMKCSVTTDGYIPQFDGYFNLKDTLEETGNGAAKNFQMKKSGLYHESQIIKQPDVLMLFTYVDLPHMTGDYKKNWTYYERKCEASSSLTYPVHAICAIDHEEYDKFYDYWYKSCAIDLIDLHHETHLGLHAACMAGGWYAIFKGVFGIKIKKDQLIVNPKYFSKWKQIRLKFIYQGAVVTAYMNEGQCQFISDKPINMTYHDNTYTQVERIEFQIQ